jgi:integral membrane protein
MEQFFSTPLGRLRALGFIEGISFMVLVCIAMPLKYLAGMPLAVRVVGSLHGLLFVLYVLNVVQVHIEKNWSLKTSFLLVVASFLPFGTFWTDAKILAPLAQQE